MIGSGKTFPENRKSFPRLSLRQKLPAENRCQKDLIERSTRRTAPQFCSWSSDMSVIKIQDGGAATTFWGLIMMIGSIGVIRIRLQSMGLHTFLPPQYTEIPDGKIGFPGSAADVGEKKKSESAPVRRRSPRQLANSATCRRRYAIAGCDIAGAAPSFPAFRRRTQVRKINGWCRRELHLSYRTQKSKVGGQSWSSRTIDTFLSD